VFCEKIINLAGGMPQYQPKITKEEIAQLPAVAFGGEIVVVDSEEGLAEACNYLLGQPILGFDTESRPAFQKGVVNRIALLQLSTADKCYLFRLNKLRLDKAILKILENRNITKIGLSVAGDIRELSTLRPFRPKGFVDLQALVGGYGIEELSLLKIAAIVLGGRISKAQRLSNWEAVQLTDAQQVYAATDAWICTEIYNRLRDV
jgi:ribonuclease D